MTYKEDAKKWRGVVVWQDEVIKGLYFSVVGLFVLVVGLFWILVS